MKIKNKILFTLKMKLILKNFRCYLEKEFDFGDYGILLLSGSSGTGKTTILNAINFALYGSGNKIISYGKNNCSVEMTIQNFIITRTKRPNRLVLKNNVSNIEYEDDSAQTIINESFGNSFDIISYAQQNNMNSFITLSPSEKLLFLEKFAFQGIDLEKIKHNCYNNIKKRNEELITVVSQLEMAIKQFENLVKPVKVKFPIKTKNIENSIINEPTRLKNTKILIRKASKELEDLNEKLNNLKIYNIECFNLEEKIKLLKEDIENKNNLLLENKYIGNDEFKKLEKISEKVDSFKKYINQKNKYENDYNIFSDKKTELEKELNNIQGILWKDYYRDEVESMIRERYDIKEKNERLKELKDKIVKNDIDEHELNTEKEKLNNAQNNVEEKNKILMQLYIEKEIYNCPSCNVKLFLYKKTLKLLECDDLKQRDKVICDTTVELGNLKSLIQNLNYNINQKEVSKKQVQSYKKDIEDINNFIQESEVNLNEIDEDLEYLKKYLSDHLDMEKRKKIIKHIISSEKNTEEKLMKEKAEIKQFEDDNNCSENIDENIKETVIIQKQLQKEYLILQKDIKNNKERIFLLEKKLEDLKIVCNENEDQLNRKIIEFKNKICELKEKEILHEKNIQNINLFVKYKEEYDNYMKWRDTVIKLKEEEKEKQKRYSSAMQLKEKILEAESLAIANIINSINVHCQYYLDLFFPNDSITIKLLTFKETKKNCKPQINVEVNYKEMEADLNMLSGGELSRVSLSFILGLTEIFNSKILLLDECTSSLDQELTNTVIDGIRKNFADKLVIIIAHQVVSGVFDREIKL
jgi:exonuclease SbcC